MVYYSKQAIETDVLIQYRTFCMDAIFSFEKRTSDFFGSLKTANKEAIRQQEPDRQTTAKIQQSQQNLEGGHQWPFYN